MLTKIGLDLGYANISICDAAASIYREPSVSVIDRETHRVIALGQSALDASSSEGNENAIMFRPFKNGMLYPGNITEKILAGVLRSVSGSGNPIRAVIGIPSSMTNKDSYDLLGMLSSAGAHSSFAVKRSVAALIGCGYSPYISAIGVNIGAGATEIAILHGGKILFAKTAEVGGEDFDRAISDYISSRGDVNVSLSVARAIKEKIGAVWEGKPSESIEIEGTLSLTGDCVRMTISTEDIVGVFEKPMQKLILAIADVVRKIPTEDVQPIFANGIVLTGGGAELYGIEKMLSQVLGIKVTKASDPEGAVVRGLLRINAFLPDIMRVDKKDITSALASYYDKKQGTSK